MKGIILAGGKGSRLYPSTMATSKQLLPVYDKPLIYYPLSTMMLAGVRDILLICNPEQINQFHTLLGNGSAFGISINYAVQSEPDGIPNAFMIGQHFLGDEDALLVLGDNIVFGSGLRELLQTSIKNNPGCTIFTQHVADPQQFGVLALDDDGIPNHIEEKPRYPKSNLAITGIYAFANDAIKLCKDLKPSARGETEIVDLINVYLKQQRLNHINLGRGFAWFDTGTSSALLGASQFVETIETRQGQKVSCPEEIAFFNGWLDLHQLKQIIKEMPASHYSEYLSSMVISFEKVKNFKYHVSGERDVYLVNC